MVTTKSPLEISQPQSTAAGWPKFLAIWAIFTRRSWLRSFSMTAKELSRELSSTRISSKGSCMTFSKVSLMR